MIGEEPVTIDDITTDAAIVLRHHQVPQFAAMRIDAADAMSTDEVYAQVGDLVRGFRNQLSLEDAAYRSGVEAVLIGGEFREHRLVDEGIFVYAEHVLARRRLEEALRVHQVRVVYQEGEDRRAIKSIRIEGHGVIDMEQRREGDNEHDADMSEVDYENTIARNKHSM